MQHTPDSALTARRARVRTRRAGLTLTTWIAVLAGPPVGAAVLEVRVEPAAGAILPGRLKIEAERVAGTGDLKKSFAVGSPAKMNELEVAAGVWRVVVRGPGLWAGEQLVTVDDAKDRKPVLFKMWPTGRLTGRVELLEPEKPEPLEVTFESPPAQREGRVPRNTIRCPIREGAWSCDVPSAALDLEFRLRGFISQHRWGLKVSPAGTLDVGVISFRRGSSVEGIVKTGSGARAGPLCRVSLKTGYGEPVVAAAGQQPIFAILNDRGFYQLTGMPPGRFVLEAEQAGWARAATPVVIDQDMQVKLAPLVIEKPEPLVLMLSPPLDPTDKPWTVQLLDVGSGGLSVGPARAATKEGLWREEGLRSGPYLVNVSASSGDRWLAREIELPQPGPVQLDVEVVRIVGTVRLGDQPLRAQVLFGGEHGAVRVSMRSDEEGRFQGVVPKREPAPEWQVYVTADDPPVRRTFRHVRPQRDAAGDAAVELAIPDVRLKGRVVDEQGQPYRCIINAQSLDQVERVVQTWAAADGTFEVVGLPPGHAEVQCDGGRRSSGRVGVELNDKTPTEVTLAAKPYRTLKGRVLSPEGAGVAGARVKPFPRQLPKLWLQPAAATSGPDGNFEVRVPHDTQEVTFTAAALGFALTSVRKAVASETPSEITLSRYGGTLQLEFPAIRAMDFQTTAAAYLVTPLDYELVQNPLLQEWATANLAFGEDGAGTPNRVPRLSPGGPSTLLLPQMAAGPYSLCLLTVRETLDLARGGPVPRERCANGTLVPGGTLPLRMGSEASP